MKFFVGLCFAALLSSCRQENLRYDKPYFDFDSLIKSQVQSLAKGNVSLVKKTSLIKKNDSTIFTPDTTQWIHELDAFQQLDVINKPSFKGQYVSSKQEDDHSNLLVRSYQTKMKSPVPEIKFYYQDGSKLKRIESVYNESNVLYSTSRKLSLEFDEQQGTSMISKYRVEGFQKMILSDSVKFFIEGKLRYP
jgi:hypothetical protein